MAVSRSVIGRTSKAVSRAVVGFRGTASASVIASWIASRQSSAAWYDVSDTLTLYQDTAGTTPIASVGDPVRLIVNKGGNADFDLLIHDNTKPGLYATRGGVPCVNLNSEAGYRCGADVTLEMPLFLALAQVFRSYAKQMLGVVRSSTGYLQLTASDGGQNRAQLITHASGLGGPSYNPHTSAFRLAPMSAPHVVHAQFEAGSHDLAVEDYPITSEANGWTTESDSAARISLGMATNSAESDADCDFFGGLVYFGEIGSDRAALVAELGQSIVRPLTDSDRNILVVGDSTGDGLNETIPISGGEWVYRWAERFATDNPTAYVEIRGWESGRYLPPIIIQDGTGDVIRIWNGSIAGSQPGEALGANFADMIAEIPTCDTVAINHGYNPVAAGNPENSFASQLLPLIESVKAEHSGAHMFLLRQPRVEADWDDALGDAGLDPWVDMIDELALLYDTDVIDIWQLYRDYGGTPADLYNPDKLHPSALGASLQEAEVDRVYKLSLPLETHRAGYLGFIKPNLLSNELLDTFTGGDLDDWTKSGGGTVASSTAQADTGRSASLAITDTGATQTSIAQTVDVTALAGETITLSVRRYIDVADGDTANSRLEMSSNGTGSPSTYVNAPQKWRGGWQWANLQLDLPADATSVTVTLYGRHSGDAATVYYSEASLVKGLTPSRVGADQGLVAESLAIDGASNQYATVDLPPDLLSNGCAIEFSALDVSAGQVVMSRGGIGSSNDRNGGHIELIGGFLAIGTGAGWRRALYTSGAKYRFVYDPEGSGHDKWRIFEDGTELTYTDSFASTAWASTSEPLYFGRRSGGTPQQMDGSLGTVKIWSRPQLPTDLGSPLIELGDIDGDTWRDVAGYRDADLVNY